MAISYQLFLQLNFTFTKLEACYIRSQWGEVQSKECYFMLTYTFLTFFFFSSQKLYFYHFLFLMKYKIFTTEY